MAHLRKHNRLTRSQVMKLCDLPKNDPQDPVAVRDRCLLLLLAEVGLRLSEIARLDTHDVWQKNRTCYLRITSGWRSPERVITISDRTFNAIADWLFVRPVQGPNVFMRVNKVGAEHGLWWEDPLSKTHLGKTLARYGNLIGIDHLSMFDLRCYVARQLSRQSTLLAMRTLGHSDPVSTARMQVADRVIDTNHLY